MWVDDINRFVWLGGARGTAGSENVGTGIGNVATLGANGRLYLVDYRLIPSILLVLHLLEAYLVSLLLTIITSLLKYM